MWGSERLLGVERAAVVGEFSASERERLGFHQGYPDSRCGTKRNKKGFLEGGMTTGGSPGVSPSVFL